jgi:hypothetical protein
VIGRVIRQQAYLSFGQKKNQGVNKNKLRLSECKLAVLLASSSRHVAASPPRLFKQRAGKRAGIARGERDEMACHVRVGDSADEILGRPGFAFSQTRTDVDLVVVSLAELGFNDSTSLADIYRRAGELGLELCPAEVAPLLRLQYADPPIGEFLNVAMRPVETYGGQPIALSVANAGTGPLLLGGEAHPDFLLNGMAKLVFVRPARIALPNVR